MFKPCSSKRLIVSPLWTAFAFSIALISPACAQSIQVFDYLSIVSIKQREFQSPKVQQLAAGGYELASGGYVNFAKWYQPKNPDLQFDFLTQLTPGAGILWGFSTGEYGEKYTVQPSFKLGFILQHSFNENAGLSFSFSRLLGGNLKEKPCTADYGDIGGVQTVHCRFAAISLEPSATLKYLVNIPAPDRNRLSVRFTARF